MRHRIYFAFCLLFLLSLPATPVNAGGFGFPLPFPLPIPKPGGGNNSNSGLPNIQQLIAAAQAEVQQEITRQVGVQLGVDAPLKLDQTTAYPTTDDVPNFSPQPWKPQSGEDFSKPLLPGDYAIPVAVFCTQYSIHVPGRGTPYKLAPVQGRQAHILSRLLVRGTLQGIPHNTLMWMSWRIEGGVPLSQWSPQYQAIVHQVDPEDEQALQGDLLAKVQKTYDDHNHIPFVKLPPLDKMLGDMGAPGQYVLDMERTRKIFADKTHAAEMEPSLLYQPQGDGLPLNLPPVQGASPSPWSRIRPGIYARFTPLEGWQGENLLEFRITSEAITVAPNTAAPSVINTDFSAAPASFMGLTVGNTYWFPTIDTITGMATSFVEGQLVRTGGQIAIRVLVVTGVIAEAPEIGTLMIGYSVYKACQALILMSRGHGDGGGNDKPKFKAPEVPKDPTQSPGEGWEWRGKEPVGGDEGAWYNPETQESLHPDLNHGEPIGPHWDWTDPSGKVWRIFPDGSIKIRL